MALPKVHVAAALAAVFALFGAAAPAGGQAAPTPPRAEILWDRWGTAHVYARGEPELFRAFGWAQAEAHGALVLRLYGEARGRAAEYWGPRNLDGDRLVRTLGIPGRASEWLRAQSPAIARDLEAFADGINAYARANPAAIPDSLRRVLPVTPTDVLAHMQRVIHFTFHSEPASVAAAARRPPAGSNAWAVAPRRSASGHALLLANPHLPWDGVYTWFEAQLVAPGIDAYGAALVGFPFLGIAFNPHLGWTHTVNTLDGDDVYALTLAEGGYRWDGAVRPFDTREETIGVRQPDGSLRTETLVVRSSVHGPVLGEREGKAFALRVSGLDQPHMLEQYWQMARATSLAQFEAALSRLQMPMFTVMYADRAGNVMHVFNGRVPARPRGGWSDWTGVVNGDSASTLWTQTLPYGALPRVLNPPSGWLQNANDPPWNTTVPTPLRPNDFPAYMAPRTMALRPQHSAELLMADSSITLDELIAYKHDTHAELADRLVDGLVAAARAQGTPEAREAAGVLASWDRATRAGSRGAVLFSRWLGEYARRTRGQGFADRWREDAPLTTPNGVADPAAAAAALDSAARLVRATYGAIDVPWGDVYRLRGGGHDLPASGGPDALGIFRALWFDSVAGEQRLEAVGGDGYVAAIEFGPRVRARALMAPGNATQPGSRHRADQLPLMSRQELRDVWLTRAEVEANLESRESF
ncbi:MAG TPA: acylase [Longimicrobium sp.]|nr:acylase [Longimicrobium sp.]